MSTPAPVSLPQLSGRDIGLVTEALAFTAVFYAALYKETDSIECADDTRRLNELVAIISGDRMPTERPSGRRSVSSSQSSIGWGGI